jgi:hypothetical protein
LVNRKTLTKGRRSTSRFLRDGKWLHKFERDDDDEDPNASNEPLEIPEEDLRRPRFKPGTRVRRIERGILSSAIYVVESARWDLGGPIMYELSESVIEDGTRRIVRSPENELEEAT